MPIHLFLSASLRHYIPDYDPEKGVEVQVEKGTTVSRLCRLLEIPEDEVKIVMIDGRGKTLAFELLGNERVGLFPPIGGG